MVRDATPSDPDAPEEAASDAAPSEGSSEPGAEDSAPGAEDSSPVTGRKLGRLALAKQTLSVVEKSRPRKQKRKAQEEIDFGEDPAITPVPIELAETSAGAAPAPITVARRTVPHRQRSIPRRAPAPPPRSNRGLWVGGLALAGAAVAAGAFFLWPHTEARGWRMPEEVSGRLVLGRPDDFRYADGQLSRARESAALAALAEQRALALVEYAEGDPARVRAALAAAAQADTTGAEEPTLAVANAGLVLAELGPRPEPPALASARTEVDRALASTRRDPRALYLDGVLRMRGGDREGARAALVEVDANGTGPVRAGVLLADLALDGGDPDAALAGYEAALARAPGHPRALIGRALARAEMRDVPGEAVAGLLDELDRATRELKGAGALGARVARAALLLPLDAQAAGAELAALPADATRRQLAYAGLLRVERGDLAEAGRLRAQIGDLGDPALVALLDAELALERGAPEDALAAAGARSGLRGRVVRGRALLELGRVPEAQVELAAARRMAPRDARVAAFEGLARSRASGADGDAALADLGKREVSDGVGRYCLAEAELARGDLAGAERHLREAVAGPLAFRARTRLAQLALESKDAHRLEGVDADLRAALEQAPDHLPARALLGRYLVAAGQPQAALTALNPLASAGRTQAADDIAMAQAYTDLGERARAKDLVRLAAHKGATPEMLRDVVKAIGDAALAAELNVR